jgi:hypothetical protein
MRSGGWASVCVTDGVESVLDILDVGGLGLSRLGSGEVGSAMADMLRTEGSLVEETRIITERDRVVKRARVVCKANKVGVDLA